MKDWEAYKLITELMEVDYSAPAEFTMDEANGWYEAIDDFKGKLLDARKPFEDSLYAEYMKHEQRPWCDACGGLVAAYASGWEHYYKNGGKVDPWFARHEITTKEYHYGSEALVEKRLRFEIEF